MKPNHKKLVEFEKQNKAVIKLCRRIDQESRKHGLNIKFKYRRTKYSSFVRYIMEYD